MASSQKRKSIAHPFPKHELSKSYEPEKFEKELYQFWESNGLFEAKDTCEPGQEAFCIVIPPPNVTGVLHMGHALTNTIQDTLIRWRRMHGDNTLWLPGTDHAGIATQAQVEKAIAKEGKGPSGRPLTRHDLGREAFLKRVWKWKEDHGAEIKNQLRRLGSSLDWSRERFTMDEGLSHAVKEVFVRLYEEGLIYRGERIINWCVRCRTALSDLEVIPQDRKGQFWHLSYPVVDAEGRAVLNASGAPECLVIATTRPETLLGDTAVAVHPDDERYRHLHGRHVRLPLLGRILPIITDSYVDLSFGSGALKVTPAHDFNDYDLGLKHQLPIVTVMGKDGLITSEGGPYAGLKFAEAREKVVADLEASGALVKTEPHAHKVGLCQRCDQVAEPMISKQWFVKIEPLAKPAIQVVESGDIQFSPKSWEKTYFEWMRNIRDWCISRQLWWGHQIPAWYCSQCSAVTVSRAAPQVCSGCQAPSTALTQDEDVLDTWFSSGLWPFSTLGWPEKTAALKTFYPTAILETGFDIIFFWVARMIMLGKHFMGEVPFRKVYLHAMVRDEKGEKMSKSKGNVIDPLDVIAKHGADPLRFTLLLMAGQGRDIKLSVDRVEDNRAFCNKLWNATRFFLMQLEPEQGGPLAPPAEGLSAWITQEYGQLSIESRWLLSRLETTVERVEKGLKDFELNESAQAIVQYAWLELCDWGIELTKFRLKAHRKESLYVLHFVLERLLKLMHPLMPFVSEELWQVLPWREESGSLMVQPFPVQKREWVDSAAELKMRGVQNVIEALRNFRGENNLSPKVEFVVEWTAQQGNTEPTSLRDWVQEFKGPILAVARIQDLVERTNHGGDENAFESVIPLAHPALELRISLHGLVNVEEEKKRVLKQIENLQSDLAHIRRKLSQETFLAKAPPALVESEREKERVAANQVAELEKALSKLEARK